MALSLLNREQARDFLEAAPSRTRDVSGSLLIRFGQVLGLLLCGYMFFDKAFAYIRIPGTPLYVGELCIILGALGVLSATGYLRIPLREEPVLAILTAWFLWGLIRFLPGFQTYGIMAVRDFALCYYCLFAYFIIAALARAPEILETWVAKFSRVLPWLLVWLPADLIVAPLLHHAPSVPFSGGVSVLTHEPGNASIAALIALGYMWLFPSTRSARTRALLSLVALVAIALGGTQNRASLVGAAAGITTWLMFMPGSERLRLIVRGVTVTVLGLGLAIGLSLKVPARSGSEGRAYSATQLVDNLLSIGAGGGAGDLGGTVAGRDQLWSLVFHEQLVEGRLFDGLGFGVNLPYLVGDTQVTYGPDPLRSPHNSHDDVLARMGLIGLSLWVILWLGWYWQLIVGHRRLARRGLHARRRVAVLCMIVVSTILVTSYFSPQMEGAQIAVLQWTAFGVGIAVTSFRGWFGRSASTGPDVVAAGRTRVTRKNRPSDGAAGPMLPVGFRRPPIHQARPVRPGGLRRPPAGPARRRLLDSPARPAARPTDHPAVQTQDPAEDVQYDRQIIAAVKAEDPAGMAMMYDKYAAALYGYCHWMLHDSADSARALQNTFVIAVTTLGDLSEPSKLRPRLFALARNECRRRIRPASAACDEETHAVGQLSDATREASDGVCETPDAAMAMQFRVVTQPANGRAHVDGDRGEAELRTLIQSILAGLKPREREVMELSFRHDLYDDELAIALGVSRSRAHAQAVRARSRLEEALCALHIALTRRKACPVLGEWLTNWDGHLTDETLDLVVWHIEECQACAYHRWGALRAASFSRLLPLTPVPPELREQVLSCCTSTAEDAAANRQRVTRRAESIWFTAFTWAMRHLSWASIRANPGMAIAAVAVALWAVAAVSVTLLTFAGSHPAHAPATTATSAPSPKPSNSPKSSESPSPSSATSPSPSSTRTPWSSESATP